MNIYLGTAAVLSLLGGVIHSVLGERLIFRVLPEAGLPEVSGSRTFTKRILRLFWHLVSVAWWGLAAVLWGLAAIPNLDATARWLANLIGLTFLASFIVALVGSHGRHFAWVVLLLIALLVWLGLR